MLNIILTFTNMKKAFLLYTIVNYKHYEKSNTGTGLSTIPSSLICNEETIFKEVSKDEKSGIILEYTTEKKVENYLLLSRLLIIGT